jgi:hypothetical protein
MKLQGFQAAPLLQVAALVDEKIVAPKRGIARLAPVRTSSLLKRSQ